MNGGKARGSEAEREIGTDRATVNSVEAREREVDATPLSSRSATGIEAGFN